MDYIESGIFAHCQDPSMIVAAVGVAVGVPANNAGDISLHLTGEVNDGGVPFSLAFSGREGDIFGWFCPWGYLQEQRFSKKRGS